MNISKRVVFGSGQRGGHHLLPEIIEVGQGHFAKADCGHLRPHTHKDAFEFCLIVSGEVEWHAGGTGYVLRGGDVFVTRPEELHWGRDTVMHPCTLYWLILGSLNCGFDWPGLEPALAAYLDQRLHELPTHQLRSTSILSAAFAEIFDEHANLSLTLEQLALQRGNARAALQRLMIELVRAHDRRRADAESDGPRHDMPYEAKRAITMLHRYAQEPDAVRRTCKSLGGDYRVLNRQFIQYFGTTLSQYWLRERVRLARERLVTSDIAVTDVATQLGFSSSQHFATVFRNVTGLSPSEYRNGQTVMKQTSAR
jgi:AraC-like DNA-binding protein/mannose-6-phosphate isomerase-like protein (cupin superfamily)